MGLIYTPDAGVVNTARKEEHWPPEFMKHLATFASTCETTHLGIVCNHCRQALQGANAREDNYWRMECACRTYIGRNPLPTRLRKDVN